MVVGTTEPERMCSQPLMGDQHSPYTSTGGSSSSHSQPLVGDQHMTCSLASRWRRRSPNPSWGISTALSAQPCPSFPGLPTPHGISTRSSGRWRRGPTCPPNPSWGTSTCRHHEALWVVPALPTPNGYQHDHALTGEVPIGELLTPHRRSAPVELTLLCKAAKLQDWLAPSAKVRQSRRYPPPGPGCQRSGRCQCT